MFWWNTVRIDCRCEPLFELAREWKRTHHEPYQPFNTAKPHTWRKHLSGFVGNTVARSDTRLEWSRDWYTHQTWFFRKVKQSPNWNFHRSNNHHVLEVWYNTIGSRNESRFELAKSETLTQRNAFNCLTSKTLIHENKSYLVSLKILSIG